MKEKAKIEKRAGNRSETNTETIDMDPKGTPRIKESRE